MAAPPRFHALGGGVDDVVVAVEDLRIESQLARRYRQTFSTGFSSGEREGREDQGDVFRHGPACPSAPSGAVESALRDRPAHLDEIGRTVAKGAHAVLLLDRAGWHTTARLVVPKNITLIFLPSRSPELNPVENVWQYLRANWLSNRVFDSYDDIIDAACDAWNRLAAQPKTITSIGMREWAHIGQA